jgi:single-stranded-DNA-specific exonuclease
MTSVATRWRFSEQPDAAASSGLADALHIPEALASLLILRGFGSIEDAKAFLRPSLASLSDPAEFKDLPEAARLVAEAVRAGET